MIGKPVTGNELLEVLDREKKREGFKEQLEDELKGIKPGECLVYGIKVGMGGIAGLALSFWVDRIGLKMVTEGDKTYIYKVK